MSVTPYYSDGLVTIYHGDCREVLPTLAPESVTLLWTDPPYRQHPNEKPTELPARFIGWHTLPGDLDFGGAA